MAPPVPITYVGQRVEADYFETEFNEEVTETLTKDGQIFTKTHVKKLTSHGNALAYFVSIDVFPGKVHGRLVQSMKHSLDHVQYTILIHATVRKFRYLQQIRECYRRQCLRLLRPKLINI